MKCPGCGSSYADELNSCPTCGRANNDTFTGRIANAVDKAVGPGGVTPGIVYRSRIVFKRTAVFLICMFIAFLVVFSIAVSKGVPLYIGVFFTSLPLLFLAAAYYSNRKVSQVDLGNPINYYKEQLDKTYGKRATKVVEGMNLFGNEGVGLQQGEEIVAFASPVYRLQSTVSGPGGLSVEKYTENTIVVTSSRVLFLTCALPGQGLVLGGGSQDMINDVVKRRTLHELAQKEVEGLKIGTISDHFPNDFWIDRKALKEVDYLKYMGPAKYASAGAISFRLNNGKKARYHVIEGSDMDKLVSIFNAVKKMFMA